MHRNTKVATCCYCGTRAALVLDRGRHELVCSGCGAPLHELKAMPIPQTDARSRGSDAAAPPYRGGDRAAHGDWNRKPRKPGKPLKKKKSVAKRFFEEAFDLIEDIFD